jgi:cytochrome P450
MKKLDSVLRESQRMNGLAIGRSRAVLSCAVYDTDCHLSATVLHKAVVPCTLSDGTYLPKGTWISAPASAIHDSDLYYEDPLKFDGFRFSKMREQPGNEAKFQLVNTTNSFLPFGHGKHAW